MDKQLTVKKEREILTAISKANNGMKATCPLCGGVIEKKGSYVKCSNSNCGFDYRVN